MSNVVRITFDRKPGFGVSDGPAGDPRLDLRSGLLLAAANGSGVLKKVYTGAV